MRSYRIAGLLTFIAFASGCFWHHHHDDRDGRVDIRVHHDDYHRR
jgi:hypothetical protein